MSRAVCVFFVVMGLAVSRAAYAKVGVGVGLGSVHVEETIAAGGVYKIANLPVINTGTEVATYKLKASLVKGPVLARRDPAKFSNWFSFQPQKFALAPSQSKTVKVTLTLPFSAPTGEYQVFLEAAPQVSVVQGVAIGPAAATKLRFAVASGSVLAAFQNRLATWVYLHPWIYLFLAISSLTLAVFVFRQNFALKVDKRSGDKYHR